METNRFRSVISILDPLPGRRQHVMPPASIPTSLEPVSSKSLSFSISAILGLEDNDKRQDSPSIERNPPLSELCVCTPSPQHSYSDNSPQSPPYSDNTSSTSECASEPDQVPTHSEQPPRKKRQRTIFSQIEVWKLERAYRRRPYLTAEDAKELVKSIGIPARSLKYWFRNRRAKARKQGIKVTSVCQTNSSDQFGRPVNRVIPCERPQFRKQAERMSYPVLEHQLTDKPHYRPITTDRHFSLFQSNQLRSSSSFPVPMFHPDQFKRRPAEPARLPYSRDFPRYQPY